MANVANVSVRTQYTERAAAPAAPTKGPLPLSLLTALVVGSMIGSGIFALPQNMASGAGAGAVLIGWLITGVGMLCLALVYRSLAARQPALDNGVYAYARASAGEYVGFNAAWGYWVSAWVGNVSYLVIFSARSATLCRCSAKAIRRPRSWPARCCCGHCTTWCCAASAVRPCSTR